MFRLEARRLTDEQFAELWNRSPTASRVASRCQLTVGRCKQRAVQLRERGLELKKFKPIPGRQLTEDMNCEANNPTPEEIADICQQIKATWSEQVEQTRIRDDWRTKAVEI